MLVLDLISYQKSNFFRLPFFCFMALRVIPTYRPGNLSEILEFVKKIRSSGSRYCSYKTECREVVHLHNL